MPGGRYVVLDLNGHKVDGNECNRSVIAVGGSLTITDSQGNGTITGSKNTGFGGSVFGVKGTGSLTHARCMILRSNPVSRAIWRTDSPAALARAMQSLRCFNGNSAIWAG